MKKMNPYCKSLDRLNIVFYFLPVLLFLPATLNAHRELALFWEHQKVNKDLAGSTLRILHPGDKNLVVENTLFFLANCNTDMYDPDSVEISINGKYRIDPEYRLPYTVKDKEEKSFSILRIGAWVKLFAVGQLGPNTITLRAQNRNGGREEATVRFLFKPFPVPVTFDVFEISEESRARPAAVRVIFIGTNGTETPDFSPHDYDVFNRHRNFTFLPGGKGSIRLPRGTFKVYITRGMAYSVATVDLDTTKERHVSAVLRKHINGPGILSGDFHVHCLISQDSIVPPEQRVLEYRAAGVDFIVASDHDTFTNYEAILNRSSHAAVRMPVLIGNETSVPDMGNQLGHWNIYPFHMTGNDCWAIKPFPADMRMGSVSNMYEAFALEAFSPRWRGKISAAESLVIQLNHPRGLNFVTGDPIIKKMHAYFNFRRIDIARELETYVREKERTSEDLHLFKRSSGGGYRAIDFDALEIMNRKSIPLYKTVRKDWFTFLNFGFRKTATANSDSHSLVMVSPGFPRNYVFLGHPESPDAEHLEAGVVHAVKQGRVLGTTGPFIRFKATSGGKTAGLGHLLPVKDHLVTLDITVKAVRWVPVHEVRVICNGAIIRRYPLKPNANPRDNRVLRFCKKLDIPIKADSWMIVEAGYPLDRVDKSQPEIGGIYGIIAPDHVPVAFTNPIYFDVDRNGVFNPLKNPLGVQ